MLPDEESARIVTPSWLASIRDEIAAKLDPDIEGLQVSDVVDTTAVIEAVEKLVGAVRYARKQREALGEAARILADASDHCRSCRDCGDGPCCENCGSEAAAVRVGQLLAGARRKGRDQ